MGRSDSKQFTTVTRSAGAWTQYLGMDQLVVELLDEALDGAPPHMHVGVYRPLTRVGVRDRALGKEPGTFGRVGQTDQPANNGGLTAPCRASDHEEAGPSASRRQGGPEAPHAH